MRELLNELQALEIRLEAMKLLIEELEDEIQN